MMKPNDLTRWRVVLAVLCCFLLVAFRNFWMDAASFCLFILAAATDHWEGKLARRFNLESDFGRIADPIADKILNLGIFFALAYRGTYSVWWIVPITIREVLVTAIRIKRMREGRVLVAEWAGKLKAGIQYGTIVVAFLVTAMHEFLRGHPIDSVFQKVLVSTLFVTNAITLYSGILFFMKLKRERC